MSTCKGCGACQWTTKDVRGGANQGRQYTSCGRCGKFGSFLDGKPSAKRQEAETECIPVPAMAGSRHVPDSEAPDSQPMFALRAGAAELRTAAKRLRDEDASWKSEEPAPKRQRPDDTTVLSTALLDVIAGVGSIVKRFDQAATKLEKLASLFQKKGDAPKEDKAPTQATQDSQTN